MAAADAQDRCAPLDNVRNQNVDASPALRACLAQSNRVRLILAPGRYHLRTPIEIAQPVSIRSQSTALAGKACPRLDPAGCAIILLDAMDANDGKRTMPIEIKANHVTLSYLAIAGGSGRDAAWRARICDNKVTLPMGGGVRVRGASFAMRHSVITGMSCYTAMEIIAAATGPQLTNNLIASNGVHAGHHWSDGITILDTQDAVITGNVFLDNTDVQLIFGGCRQCVIKNNRFRHDANFAGASFAELMIHAWPNTSGDYSGTTVQGNDIDCGAARRCGYGIMIGGAPWYKAATANGTVTGNRVANAMLGVNVDGLTGPMTISNNRVSRSGGRFQSDCGVKDWPSINVAPSSRHFIEGGTNAASFGSMETAGCLLNRPSS